MHLPCIHIHRRDLHLPVGAETLLAGFVILLVIVLNVVMMWRIATATV